MNTLNNSRSECRMICSKHARSAFTLVELLVVIVIIAILTSLISVAAFSAMTTAKQTKIKTELDQLHAAMMEYKNKYGSYPPSDMSNQAAVRKHFQKAFPLNKEPILRPANSAVYAETLGHYTPAEALVFWLRGFSPDPEYPITGLGARTPLFSFDVTRLRPNEEGAPAPGEQFADGNNNNFRDATEKFTNANGNTRRGSGDPKYDFPVYVPPGADGNAPYVYFSARDYGNQYSEYVASASIQGGEGTVRAYPNAADPSTYYATGFANPDTCQIISAGLDGDYGRGGVFPAGTRYILESPDGKTTYYTTEGYVEGDEDNQANFSDKTFGDARP